jgi:ketosteroid isomerase-like protein
VRGRTALTAYYTKRFAAGARGHVITVAEVHVQGNGGYGIAHFSVTVPNVDGKLHEVHGTILAVYQRDPDGWHLRVVEPSVPESAGK